MERVADYVIRKIAQMGVEHIFMLTGRGILYLTDAVAKNESISGVSLLHEQSAAYAAMSYAKARDGVGACLVSTGCAATNAVTGALCAYQDNLPVIFISGQHMLHETTRYTGAQIRTYGSQEADIISIVSSVTKYAAMLTDPNKIAYETEKALFLATSGRQGPVWLDIPLDLQSVLIDEDTLEHYTGQEQEYLVSDQTVNTVSTELSEAKRPLLFIGGGAFACGEELQHLVEATQIPLVFSYAGCDVLGSAHPYSIGAVNSLGAPRAGNFALQNADYVLVLGSKLCSQTIGDKPQTVAREAKITVVDIDPAEHTKQGIKIDRLIISDVKAFLTRLLSQSLTQCPALWTKKCQHWKDIFSVRNEAFIHEESEDGRIDLYDFCDVISDKLTGNTAIITDAGLEELIVPSTIRYKARQKCFFAAAQGAMGYAIPAIIGAHFSGRFDEIIVIVGDGSALMNLQELLLLKYHTVNAKIFVINNDLYAVIRARQKDLFRKRTIGNDETDGVPSPDFFRLSEAFELNYQCIASKEALEDGLISALQSEKSILCEIMCKTKQRYFHTSFRKNERGKLIRPSIEDMSPFMDRNILLSEMLVTPIEN